MDLEPEQLQFLGFFEILREAVAIARSAPKRFSLITLTLVFPLSFAILFHSLFTHPLLRQIQANEDSSLLSPPSPKTQSMIDSEWTRLLTFQAFYLLFLFAFSLLSTAAVVYIVACIYTSKNVAFTTILSAIPPILKRLFITFLWVSLIMFAYNSAFVVTLVLLLIGIDTSSVFLLLVSLVVLAILFTVVHIYITAVWHLASVISVLEDVYGLAAMRKSRELLRGKTGLAAALVFVYLAACGLIGGMFSTIVVHGVGAGPVFKVFAGFFLVSLLVLVNLIGLLVQSVFYYVCKSHHHQGIDKSALYDHLGGYLGEYVPLKSSIQLESLE